MLKRLLKIKYFFNGNKHMMEKGIFTKGFAGEIIQIKDFEPKVLSKENYANIVTKQRMIFVHQNFSSVLEKLFKDLNEDALKMKVCHREIEFNIPEYFDIVKTEAILCAYFSDLGYRALPEGRKIKSEDNTKINLTLT